MELHIISTVGVSLFTNLIKFKSLVKESNSGEFEKCLNKITCYRDNEKTKLKRWSQYVETPLKEIGWLKTYSKEVIEGIKAKNWKKSNKVNTDASAEIQSIIKIIEETKLEKGAKVKLYFVATDTAEGCSAARIVAHFFSSGIYKEGAAAKEVEIEVVGCKLLEENLKIADRIKEMRNYLSADYQSEIDDQAFAVAGLQVKNLKEFQEKGLYNLLEVIGILSEQASSKKDQLVLNISGGYKAMIPVMTVFAQILSVPIKYIYEESDELFTLEQFPIDYDWDLIMEYSHFIKEFNALTKAIQLKEEDQIKECTEEEKETKEVISLKEMRVRSSEKLKTRFIVRAVDGEYQLTYLGKYLKKYLSNDKGFYKADILGKIAEHLIGAYFNKKTKPDKEHQYTILNPTPFFEEYNFLWDKERDILSLYSDKDKETLSTTEKNICRSVNDVDLELIRCTGNEEAEWCLSEIKTIQAFQNALSEKNFNKTKSQYKARILTQIGLWEKKLKTASFNLPVNDKKWGRVSSLGFRIVFLDFKFKEFTLYSFPFVKKGVDEKAKGIVEYLSTDEQIQKELERLNISLSIDVWMCVSKVEKGSDGKLKWAEALLNPGKGIQWKLIQESFVKNLK
ncbi:CRISPR-associated protein [Saprospira grandis DSM 2844]|uniref:CRISPR-associated protein n=1 Tax=Saprospira grandis DSM 2844 TaxID=694433 RepID=J1I7B5_9BACT|nr:CRISPR-associated protein [Saprospira grandis]EJF54690.1 CRISPR-associated protein [Saprospira grandis DSM 2844]